MSINANTSVLEYERLTAERAQARIARKAINRERYRRRYARIGGHKPERTVRVSEFVVVTVEPFPIHIPEYPLIHAYGPIGSDNLL